MISSPLLVPQVVGKLRRRKFARIQIIVDDATNIYHIAHVEDVTTKSSVKAKKLK